jgi:hypothetical protein
MEPGPENSTTIGSALIIAIDEYDHHPKLKKLAAAASDMAEALAEGGIDNAIAGGLKGGSLAGTGEHNRIMAGKCRR